LLVLGVAGTAVAAFKRQRFALFVGLWAFGLLAAYSFIPYKTPWLTLNFIIPLAIVGGYAVEVIHGMLLARNRTCAWIWLALFVAAMTSSIYSALQLNFYHYDDDRNSYVYAQTRREFLSLVDRINTIAHLTGRGEQTSIAVMSPDYWPLPWYLRDYRRVGYYGQISDANADIVIGSEPQKLQLALLLDKDYEWIGSYALRPGVILVVFARRHQS
jgi:predicted membrane-bound mannosyltransferase